MLNKSKIGDYVFYLKNVMIGRFSQNKNDNVVSVDNPAKLINIINGMCELEDANSNRIFIEENRVYDTLDEASNHFINGGK